MSGNTGADRHRAFDDHPRDREPFQPEGVADERCPFGRICNCWHWNRSILFCSLHLVTEEDLTMVGGFRTEGRSTAPIPNPRPGSIGVILRMWCGRRDLNPHEPCGPTDFHTRLRLSPPLQCSAGFGVWTIPSPCPDMAPGVRCCPSSLYTFPAVSGRAWLGIAMLQSSPNLSSSASPVSRRALKFRLSPMRLPIPPRPRD